MFTVFNAKCKAYDTSSDTRTYEYKRNARRPAIPGFRYRMQRVGRDPPTAHIRAISRTCATDASDHSHRLVASTTTQDGTCGPGLIVRDNGILHAESIGARITASIASAARTTALFLTLVPPADRPIRAAACESHCRVPCELTVRALRGTDGRGGMPSNMVRAQLPAQNAGECAVHAGHGPRDLIQLKTCG